MIHNFPFHIIMEPSLSESVTGFISYVIPTNQIHHDEGGLHYPPKKMWWNYDVKKMKKDVLLTPSSLSDISPILFYMSDIKSENWDKDITYATIIPKNAEAVMHCKVDLNSENVIFRYDPNVQVFTHEQQVALARMFKSHAPITFMDIMTGIFIFLIVLCVIAIIC